MLDSDPGGASLSVTRKIRLLPASFVPLVISASFSLLTAEVEKGN